MFAMHNYVISRATWIHELIYVFTFKYLAAFAVTKLKFISLFTLKVVE